MSNISRFFDGCPSSNEVAAHVDYGHHVSKVSSSLVGMKRTRATFSTTTNNNVASSNDEGAFDVDGEKPLEKEEDGADHRPTTKFKSHKEAERRRRERINSHFSTLKSLLSNSCTKTNKASLLTTAVNKVLELKTEADKAMTPADEPEYKENIEYWPFPDGNDELVLAYYNDENSTKFLRATFSCEDRLGLMGEVAKAVRSVKEVGRLVKSEMSTVGGRTKCTILIKLLKTSTSTPPGGGGGANGSGTETTVGGTTTKSTVNRGKNSSTSTRRSTICDDDDLVKLRRALKPVVNKQTMPTTGPGYKVSLYNNRFFHH